MTHPSHDQDLHEDLHEELEIALDKPWTSGRGHPHVHNPASQRKLLNRLARIQGHVQGIRSMVEQNQPCSDVLLQLAAVQGALDKVARLILDEHMSQCITQAAKTGDIQVELEELKKALDRFLR